MKFYAKLNKVVTNPNLADLLDSGEIDFAFMAYLKQLRRLCHSNKGYLQMFNRPRDFEFLEHPITKAFLEENILHYNKYTLTVKFEQGFYPILIDYFYEANKREKIKFPFILYFRYIYSRFKAIQFSENYFDIGSGDSKTFVGGGEHDEKGNLEYAGFNVNWDVPNELYKEHLGHEIFNGDLSASHTNIR